MGTAWPKTVLIRTPICVGDTVKWDAKDGSTPCPDLMVRSINEENQTLCLAGVFIVDGKKEACCREVPSRECEFDRKKSPDQKVYL